MHTRIYRLTLAALVGLAVPATASEYEASDYLPLAVGNSWTFDHDVYDREVFMSEADAYPVTSRSTEARTSYPGRANLPNGDYALRRMEAALPRFSLVRKP